MGSDETSVAFQFGVGNVSTHAPAWGATTATEPVLLTSEFQSTLPHGERLY